MDSALSVFFLSRWSWHDPGRYKVIWIQNGLLKKKSSSHQICQLAPAGRRRKKKCFQMMWKLAGLVTHPWTHTVRKVGEWKKKNAGRGGKKGLWQIQFARARDSACRQAYISITHMIEQPIHHTHKVENLEEMRGRRMRRRGEGVEVRTLHLNSIRRRLKGNFYVCCFCSWGQFSLIHCLLEPSLNACKYMHLCPRDGVCSLPLTSGGGGMQRLLELLFCEGQSRRLQSSQSPPSRPFWGKDGDVTSGDGCGRKHILLYIAI